MVGTCQIAHLGPLLADDTSDPCDWDGSCLHPLERSFEAG